MIDSPPHAETEARIAVRTAKLVIVPVPASPMDVWATRPTLDMVAQERILALLVLNRAPDRPLPVGHSQCERSRLTPPERDEGRIREARLTIVHRAAVGRLGRAAGGPQDRVAGGST